MLTKLIKDSIERKIWYQTMIWTDSEFVNDLEDKGLWIPSFSWHHVLDQVIFDSRKKC